MHAALQQLEFHQPKIGPTTQIGFRGERFADLLTFHQTIVGGHGGVDGGQCALLSSQESESILQAPAPKSADNPLFVDGSVGEGIQPVAVGFHTHVTVEFVRHSLKCRMNLLVLQPFSSCFRCVIILFVMDETALINQAKKGDLDAFNRLVLEFQDQAFNLALRMLGDQPSAEDAVQMSFISAYENLRSFRGGSFRAWILRITANNCLNELRRQKRKPTTDLSPEDPETGDEMESPDWLADESMSPEEKVSQKELESVIQRCIQALPDEFRTVVLLVDVQGLDYQEASEVVSTPLGTIRSRLARARQRLQECLQGAWELLPDKYRLYKESRPV
ncbi:MAG: sigma-70 family RNA polymerase sigma factor [Chloroflexi bacterium]|nr:sigma-70 family RNA polymerase sigma factor [Chloroflexota bacterium]